MKERPIIFSTESVRAILDGRKTQTRRAVKPQIDDWEPYRSPEWYTQTAIDRDGMEVPGKEVFGVSSEDGEHGRVCPFGAPGDRLWVREAFVCEGCPKCCAGIPALGGNCTCEEYVLYGDTVPVPAIYPPQKPKLTSPVFMPRKFSRLTLEITDVRCERLHDISWDDCIQEGTFQFHGYRDEHGIRSEGKRLFAEMWNTINAKRGFSWDTNPWVWVIEFKRVEKENE